MIITLERALRYDSLGFSNGKHKKFVSGYEVSYREHKAEYGEYGLEFAKLFDTLEEANNFITNTLKAEKSSK